MQRYLSCHEDCPAQIYPYDNPFLMLDDLDKMGGFDLLLLDIYMPGILGTQVAAEVRQRGFRTQIVFLTTSNEFAVDAFSLKAAHYLLKPFSFSQLEEAMDRCLESFQKSQGKTVTIKTENSFLLRIDVDEIIYIESNDHTQSILLKNDTWVESRLSMTRLMQELNDVVPGQFVVPYKGYIVNQKFIRSIETKKIILIDGRDLPIARGSYRKLQSLYIDFLFQVKKADASQ